MHKNYEVDKTLVRHLKTRKLLFRSFRNERIWKTGYKFGLPVATISLEIIQKYVTEQWMIKSNMKCKCCSNQICHTWKQSKLFVWGQADRISAIIYYH